MIKDIQQGIQTENFFCRCRNHDVPCVFFLDSRSESSILTVLLISSNMIDPNYFKQNLNWPKGSVSTNLHLHSIFAPHIMQVKFHGSEYRQWDLVSTQ